MCSLQISTKMLRGIESHHLVYVLASNSDKIVWRYRKLSGVLAGRLKIAHTPRRPLRPCASSRTFRSNTKLSRCKHCPYANEARRRQRIKRPRLRAFGLKPIWKNQATTESDAQPYHPYPNPISPCLARGRVILGARCR